jgi:hypothetical protein
MEQGASMSWRAAARIWALWLGGGLIINFAWEMLQMPLYGRFEDGGWRCLEAALADTLLLGLLYFLMACAAEDWIWFARMSRWRVLLLAVLGLLVATVVELRALVAHAWSYRAGMPRLPFLGVGLLPALQMVLIPLGLAWMSRAWALGNARRGHHRA